uniref:molybdopterin-dependent oxidoreductase n=9 Tax=Enterobacterales TaxID=91347 RepID=UPI000BC4EA7F
CSDLYLTPSAKYADILLPETSFLERWNIGGTWSYGDYIILSEKVIEPEFERRTDYDWLREVADKLGVGEQFSEGKATDRDWIEYLVNDASIKRPEDGIPTFDELLVKRRHLLKHRPHTQNVAFEKNIQDIENNPFPTPSGKIEIFSKRLYEMK